MANGVIIGGTTFSNYRTWASLRTVFARFTGFNLSGYPPYNRNYEVNMSNFLPSFKSAGPGSGLIRADRYARSNGTSPNLEFRNFYIEPPTGPGLPWLLELNWFDSDIAVPSTLVPKEVQDQLTGQTVVFQDGITTITITSALFSPPDALQPFTAILGPGFPASIGKLTPIT
jgi:hypothetical protein